MGEPARQPPLREYSAGGLVVRRFHGRPFVAVIHLKGGSVLALPKGHPDGNESMAEAAVREVREETGLDTTLVEKLGDIRYWYVRDGKRVLKVVSFFLFRYRGGSVRNHDAEVESAGWILLADAPSLLTFPGERQMAEAALTRLGDSR